MRYLDEIDAPKPEFRCQDEQEPKLARPRARQSIAGGLARVACASVRLRAAFGLKIWAANRFSPNFE
jgi:hypothetical protein